MKTKRSYHKIIKSGGQGCVFEPAIPCSKRTKRKKKRYHKKTVSKVSFNKHSAEREIAIDDLVRKIPNHEDWAILWNQKCETPPYKQLTSNSDIKECLDKKNIHRTETSRFPMLVGPFGGQTIFEYTKSRLKKSTVQSQTNFDRFLGSLISTLEPLFEGLVSLRRHKLCHGDLSIRNILVKDNQTHMIDFGLSFRFSNKSYLKERLRFIYSLDRAYDPYPYEFTLYPATKKQLKDDLRDLQNKSYREGHEDYIRFHETILDQPNANQQLKKYIQDRINGSKKPSLETLVNTLDTYSLGILVPTLLHDISLRAGISFKTLQQRCQKSKHKEFFQLCRDMTEFLASDRISPKDALKRFTSISSIQ